MRDPITGPLEFGFFALALVLVLWIALDTRGSLSLLLFHSHPAPDRTIRFLRVLSGLCASGLAILLVSHLLRSR